MPRSRRARCLVAVCGFVVGATRAHQGRDAHAPQRRVPDTQPAICGLDICHVTAYTGRVIKTFRDRHTGDVYRTGRSWRLPPDVVRRGVRRLEYVDLAASLADLRVPPSNHLHALRGDRQGQYAISINDQWRICFRFEDGHAYDVEITDYH